MSNEDDWKVSPAARRMPPITLGPPKMSEEQF